MERLWNKLSNIAIIDADIVGKKKHRFPNLCCMKISAYHKKLGDTVILKTDYNNLDAFDKVYRLRVERPSFKSSLNKEELKHKTETALDNYTNYEYTIINDGSLEDLNNKVKQIVDEVI